MVGSSEALTIMKAYVNGSYTNESSAKISIQDHGFLYGDGIYETIRIREGQCFLWPEHYRRLKSSAKGIHLDLPWSKTKLESIIKKLIRLNKKSDAVLRITVTRGKGEYGFDPDLCLAPTLVITMRAFHPYPPKFFSSGISLALVPTRRNHPAALPPSVKSTSCLNGVLAKIESKRLRAHEALLLTLEGTLSEGSVSSLFLVKKKVVYTPKRAGEILPGVTQGWVLKRARALGYRVVEKRLYPADLRSAHEVFITNTTMEIMPISKIINGSGNKSKKQAFFYDVGPVTQNLMARFLVR